MQVLTPSNKDLTVKQSDPPQYPLLTGSYVYGQPHQDSDIDLVVMMKQETLEYLTHLAGEEIINNESGYSPHSVPLKFGKLNLIAVSDEEEFKAWVDGTYELKRMPFRVTRDQAIAVFSRIRQERGLFEPNQEHDCPKTNSN